MLLHILCKDAPRIWMLRICGKWLSKLIGLLQLRTMIAVGAEAVLFGLVRAEAAPPVHSFPLNYGYERLQIKIVPAAKPPRPMIPQHTSQFQIPTYTSWKSQFRNYKAPVDASKRPSFKDVFQQNGPPNKKSKVQVSQQNIGLTSMAVQPAAVMNSTSSAEQSLQYQLANLQQQNAEQQAQITKLLDQIAQLTQQLQQFTHHSQQVPVPPDAEMNGGGL